MNRPSWLNKKIRLNDCVRMKQLLAGLCLHTVCQEALCPNIGECFGAGTATFLILGAVCTRSCAFCGVSKGRGVESPDPQEPGRVAEAVDRLALKHVVITSVTRDDLADGGAGVFAETIGCIRRIRPSATIEVLIPDFQGDEQALSEVIGAQPEIIAHNMETVPRLYPAVRPGADYERSVRLLNVISQRAARSRSKSGLMLGLGESRGEVIQLMRDLRAAGVELLTIGQYLAPGSAHFPVVEYIRPDQFDEYRVLAEEIGFTQVMSAPYVRSSYRAQQQIDAP